MKILIWMIRAKFIICSENWTDELKFCDLASRQQHRIKRSFCRILVDTFQDERFLATTSFRSSIEFKQLNKESANNLVSFLGKFDVAVSALKPLSLKDLADFLIVSIALSNQILIHRVCLRCLWHRMKSHLMII